MEIERALPAGQWGLDLPRQRSLGPLGSWAPPAPAVAAQPQQSDWHRYFTAIMRHKWLVLFATLIGTGLGVLGTRFLSRDYSAKTILWVERPARDAREAHDQTMGEEVVVATPGWMQLVTSNAVMDSVVRRLRLYLSPRTGADSVALASFDVREQAVPGIYRLVVDGSGRSFQLQLEDGSVVQTGTVGDSVGLDRGFLWAPGADVLRPNQQVAFSVKAPYEASTDLASSLRVRMDEGSNFLVLTLRGENPSRITATINAIANRSVAVAAEMKRRRFEELATILGEQYETARTVLDTAEKSLRNFRVRTAGVLGARAYTPEPRPGAEPEVYALSAERERIRRDRAALNSAMQAGTSTGARVDALSMIQSVQQSPELKAVLEEITAKRRELRQLRTRYTDEAAPVQELRAALDSLEGSALPAMAGQLASDLASRDQAVTPQVNQAMSQLRRLPTLELDETRLVREVSSAEELSNTIRQRYEAARLALVSSLPDVRILDAAVVPSRPSASLGPILIALAFLTSLGLACAGIVMRDGLDPRVRYPEQVTRQMRLTILGALPRVGFRSIKQGDADGARRRSAAGPAAAGPARPQRQRPAHGHRHQPQRWRGQIVHLVQPGAVVLRRRLPHPAGGRRPAPRRPAQRAGHGAGTRHDRRARRPQHAG